MNSAASGFRLNMNNGGFSLGDGEVYNFLTISMKRCLEMGVDDRLSNIREKTSKRDRVKLYSVGRLGYWNQRVS